VVLKVQPMSFRAHMLLMSVMKLMVIVWYPDKIATRFSCPIFVIMKNTGKYL